MFSKSFFYCIIQTVALLSLASCANLTKDANEQTQTVDWSVYQGNYASSKYANLGQINKTNVHQLKPIWTYRTGEVWHSYYSQIQTNPLIIDGILYGLTPRLNPFALDATTGKKLWQFDAQASGTDARSEQTRITKMGNARGLTFWQDEQLPRLFFTLGHFLHAVDARNGKLIPHFGKNGVVDLREGLGRPLTDTFISATSPPVIYRHLLIIGSRVGEGMGAAPGHIRAFDLRTGEQVWRFNTIPHPGEFGYDTWPEGAHLWAGGANNWAGMSLDKDRGMLFVPTGSATFDFWGGNRPGKNLFANSLVALRADTGARVWHHQIVHHDIWDRDLPATPNLLSIQKDQQKIDVVAQITKTGHVFVFDRDTGKPIFPIEERAVPSSPLADERTWPTQPFPVLPEPFARQSLTVDDIRLGKDKHGRSFKEKFLSFKSGQQYLPFSTDKTVIFPGLNGGGEWGGAATTPDGVLYVNASEVPWVGQLSRLNDKVAESGSEAYNTHCAGCHGADRRGGPGQQFPSLLDISQRLSRNHVRYYVRYGKGFMPAFPSLHDAEVKAIIAFLWGEDQKIDATQLLPRDKSDLAVPYRFNGYFRFLDRHRNPVITQPWGTLTAINLNTGQHVWRRPLGHLPEHAEAPDVETGTENYGGPIVTAGGLVFIAATRDLKFRAFDKDNGELLWETELPFGGYATPATYMIDGKQYVVIAAGGGKMGTSSGDAYVAFALDE